MEIEIPEPDIQIKLTITGSELRALMVAVDWYQKNNSVPTYFHDDIMHIQSNLWTGMSQFSRMLKNASGHSMLYIEDQEVLNRFREKLSPGMTDSQVLQEWIDGED